jgi:hypothetical protein
MLATPAPAIALGVALTLVSPGSAAAQKSLCALLTEAEAEAILGKPLAAPQPQGSGDCWYSEQPGQGGGDIMLHVYPYRFDSPEKFHDFLVQETKAADENMRQAVEKAGGKFTPTAVQPVEGLGAPGYWADPQLFVLNKKGKVLAIVAPREQAVAVAAKALPRLE